MYTQTELYYFKANIATKCNYRKVCGGVCVQSQERERENERGRLRDTTVLRLGKIKMTKMKILNPTATLPYLTLLSTHTDTHTHRHTHTHKHTHTHTLAQTSTLRQKYTHTITNYSHSQYDPKSVVS